MNRYMESGYRFSVEDREGFFIIKNQMGKGNSCMVYFAEFLDSKGNYTEHILKECNPSALQVKRDESGKLYVEEKETQEFEKEISRFVEGYKRQEKIRRISNLKNATTNIQSIFEAQGTQYIDMTVFEGLPYNEVKEQSLYNLLQRAKAITNVIGNYHKAGYLHLDVKPGNIFTIPETCEFVMLFDFDSLVEKDEIYENSLSYTKTWAAPELVLKDYKSICEATDLFAVGEIIFYQIMGCHSKSENRRRWSEYEYNSDDILFKNVDVQIFSKLTEFFRYTICTSPTQRYQTAEEVIEKIDEMLLLANPRESYLVSSKVIQKEFFVGRKKELQLIHGELQKNSILFVSGMGGIGKSVLAKQYVRDYKESYDTIIFLTYSGSWSTLIMDDKHLYITNLGRQENETAEEYCERKLLKLKELCDEKTLLIVDNMDKEPVDERENYIYKEVLKLKCKILITTRLTELEYPKISIRELDTLEEQVRLFEYYCNISEEEIKVVEEIIDYVDGHTLTMELIAKQIKTTFSTPSEMLHSLQKSGIYGINQEKIKYSKDEAVISQPLFGHIRTLFDITELSENEIYILTNMALLPAKGVPARKFCEWCELQEFEVINGLIEKGWIERERDWLKMHPIIAAVALEFLQKQEENIEKMLDDILHEDASREIEQRVLYVEILKNIMLCLKKNEIGIEYIIIMGYRVVEELVDLGKIDEAKKYQEVLNEVKNLLYEDGDIDEITLEIELNDGYIKMNEGNLKSAEIIFQNVIKWEREDSNEETYIEGIACLNLGVTYVRQEMYEQALKYTIRALKILKSLQEEQYVIFAYNNLGVIYTQIGKYIKAEKYLLQAWQLLQQHDNSVPKIEVKLCIAFGELYLIKEEYKEALIYAERAAEVCKKMCGDKSSDMYEIHFLMGRVYWIREKYDKAEKCYKNALNICEELECDLFKGKVLAYLGYLLVDKNQYEEAEKKCQEGIAILSQRPEGNYRIIAYVYENLAVICIEKEKYGKSIIYLKKALEHYEVINDKESIADVYQIIGYIYQMIGYTYYDKEEYDKAIIYYKKALKRFETINDKENIKELYAEIKEAYGQMRKKKLIEIGESIRIKKR